MHKKRRLGSTALLVFCSLVLGFLSGAEVLAATNTASAGTTWAGATWSLGRVPTTPMMWSSTPALISPSARQRSVLP